VNSALSVAGVKPARDHKEALFQRCDRSSPKDYRQMFSGCS
jgi:hypothetical protein